MIQIKFKILKFRFIKAKTEIIKFNILRKNDIKNDEKKAKTAAKIMKMLKIC